MAESANAAHTHLFDAPPALPPVRPCDLVAAWAALRPRRGVGRAPPTDLALANACCWPAQTNPRHQCRSLRMTPRPIVLAVVFAAAVLAGCAAPATGPRPSAAQAAACRQRADEVYDRQNRADLYRSDIYAGGARDAMFSGTGSPGASIGQLSARFARDRLVDDCLRGAANNVASTPDAPSPIITTVPPSRPKP